MARIASKILPAATPADLLGTWMNVNMLMVETCSVMTMRIMGMAGMWPVTKNENQRMINEKPAAFATSMAAAGRAAAEGKRPDQVVDIAVSSLRRKTGANSRRLAKRALSSKS